MDCRICALGVIGACTLVLLSRCAFGLIGTGWGCGVLLILPCDSTGVVTVVNLASVGWGCTGMDMVVILARLLCAGILLSMCPGGSPGVVDMVANLVMGCGCPDATDVILAAVG